ncbi:MAG: serine/threonine-protein kinase [Myxococcota bacterium]
MASVSSSSPISQQLSSAPSAIPAVGRVVAGRYRLLSLIGEGGWSHVYEAKDDQTGRTVVVKLLRSPDLDRRRFVRECSLSQEIVHPHVVQVLDSCVDGAPVLILERLEGRTLREYLDILGSLHLRPALVLLDQVASALEAVHRAGVIHRDLKPSNVMVTVRGGELWTKLIDFGLGKAADSTTITDDGYCVGTPGYMAPEQLYGTSHDPRTDIYAWGVLAYELIAGTHPFPADTEHEAIEAVLHRPPVPLSTHRKVPQSLERVVMRALRKNPVDRFPNVGLLRQALRFARPRHL